MNAHDWRNAGIVWDGSKKTRWICTHCGGEVRGTTRPAPEAVALYKFADAAVALGENPTRHADLVLRLCKAADRLR